MAGAAFEVIAPNSPRMPVVAHVPHASTVIPDEVRAEFLVPYGELADELVRLTDWYTDELFAGLRDHGVTSFVNRLSRLVFDPERFLDDSLEPMAARGQGVVYWMGSRLQLLRQATAELRARRIDELYRPYHAALDGLVGETLAEFGSCTVLDCHSFATEPLPSEIDQSPERPDICIGTDETHTPTELVEAMAGAFTEAGFRVGLNAPFAGTFVPSGYYGCDTRVHSVMIEVRRGLYIDEATAQRRSDFDEVAAAICGVVAGALTGGL